MKEKPGKTNSSLNQKDNDDNDYIQGYPPYPSNEDIYGKCQQDRETDPEDPSHVKESGYNNKTGINNEKDFDEDPSGSDLDVPGSELDDDLENIGSEDEENNYYSLGGDDHNDLEEDYVE